MEKGAKHRPFCCDRCRLVDLGKWFKEDYVLDRPLRPGDLRDLPEIAEDDGESAPDR